MKKLRLDLDHLQVETFEAGEDRWFAQRGTFQGNEASQTADCQTQCAGCTHFPTDQYTCKGERTGCGTCAGQQTCGDQIHLRMAGLRDVRAPAGVPVPVYGLFRVRPLP
jgi:hypothetical protein